ncbi:MAG: cytochrome P450 [Myxococcales bacterium]
MPPDPVYNPLDADTLENPFPIYDYLRSNAPVYWHEQMQSWVLTRYADCRNVLLDHKLFARDERRVGESIPDDRLSVQQLDPPEVIPLRRLFFQAFKAVDLEQIARRARGQIRGLLDAHGKRPIFDLMADVASPVAESLTCEFFGSPTPPAPGKFMQIAHGIALGMDAGLEPCQRGAGRAVSVELDRMVRDWSEDPIPGSFMAEVKDKILPRKYPDTLIYRTVDAMVNASYSTIYASIGNAALTLFQHPEIRAAFTPHNLVSGCDEILRFDSPAHATSRVATERTTIGGTVIERGQVVITLFAAANRDPDGFERPNDLVLDRRHNHHLGFGWGSHQCLGIGLANVALHEFVSAALALPALRSLGKPKRFRTATLRWLQNLPVTASPQSSPEMEEQRHGTTEHA